MQWCPRKSYKLAARKATRLQLTMYLSRNVFEYVYKLQKVMWASVYEWFFNDLYKYTL